MGQIKLGLLIAAVVLFIIAAWPSPYEHRLTNAGLACFAGSFLA